MGARHRVGIGLLYRPARLHRPAEFIPWHPFRGPIHVQKYQLCILYTRIQYSVEGPGGGEVWGHRRGKDLRQINHLPQSPFTFQFF